MILFEETWQEGLGAPGERWDTLFYGWGLRTLNGVGNQQWYTSPGDPGTPAHQHIGGVMYLVADQSPDTTQTGGLPYTSGMLTTERAVHLRYGRVSVTAWCPRGKGLWPAIWLVPSDGGDHIPEINVMEVLGHDTKTIYQFSHGENAPVIPLLGQDSTGRWDAADGWHTYDVLWARETVTWSIDGVITKVSPNNAHTPHHLLINLAVGGAWPGVPDATTRFPAYMGIQHVRIETC